jgi:hypothetical protein
MNEQIDAEGCIEFPIDSLSFMMDGSSGLPPTALETPGRSDMLSIIAL